MAVALRSSNKNKIYGNTSLSINKPAGTVSGDLIIISAIIDVATTMTVSGFTEFATTASQASVSSHSFWKLAGSEEPARYTITIGISNNIVGIIAGFYETTGTGTWTLSFNIGDRIASGTSQTTSSITTSANSLLYIAFSNDDDETVTTAPADMTSLEEYMINSVAISSYYELKNVDTLTKSITWSGYNEELIANTGVFTSSLSPTTGTNMQINIADTWKEVPAAQINIGDIWKEVTSMKVNIGDVWKEVF